MSAGERQESWQEKREGPDARAAATGAGAGACPDWCTEHQDNIRVDAAGNVCGCHVTSRRAGDIRVAMAMAGQTQPRLFAGGMPFSLDYADSMMFLMTRLGRRDVADAIEELAAAAGKPVTA